MINDKKFNILMFNRWVGYNEGGNETHIKELAVNLSKKGHSIDILTTGDSALQGIKSHLNNIYTIDSPQEYLSYSASRFYHVIKYLFSAFIIFDKLIRIEKRKYDVITVHFSLEALLLRIVRMIYKVPYVLILVGDTDLELLEGKRADNTSQLTHHMRKECHPYGYDPEVLTKGVDRDRFNAKISGRSLRDKYLDNDNQFLILSVCRLDPRKNLETLIKASKILEERYPNTFKTVIVGGGVEEEKLRKLIKKLDLSERVFMTGMLPSTSDALPMHYAAADVFALPTLYEGFGYVFSEAMAFSLPIISTDTSAVPEVVEDVGIIVPIRSPNKLADAIYNVYENPEYRRQLSNKSISKVQQWYWENIISDYEGFINRGIEHFNKRSSIIYRILSTIGSTVIDLPEMILAILKTLIVTKNDWGPKKIGNTSLIKKRYLVTGGAGSIGSSLVNELSLDKSNQIDIIDNLSSGYESNIIMRDNVYLHKKSVLDDKLLKSLSNNEYDYIFHLAASFANQTSVENPIRDSEVNSIGTIKMLDFATKQRRLKKFVYTSSSCIYGNGTKELMEETDNANPDTPYAISKLQAEYYTKFYYEHFGVPTNTVRLFNIYGSNEHPGKYRNVIPNFVYKAIKGEDIPVMGDGTDERDFTYINDALELILGITYDSSNTGEIYNIGSGSETKIIDLAKLIISRTKSNSKIVFLPKRKWDKISKRKASIKKASKFKKHEYAKLADSLDSVIQFITSIDNEIDNSIF